MMLKMTEQSALMVVLILALFLFGCIDWHGDGSNAILCVSAQDCNNIYTFNGTEKSFAKCLALQTLGAKLAWTYHEVNSTVDLVFEGTATSSSGWVGWGINPNGEHMVGTSSLIAFAASNGSNLLPYMLTNQVQMLETPLTCSPIDLVINNTAVQISGTSMIFFVSFKLPSDNTLLSHIWNRGPSVTNFQPSQHDLGSADLSSFTTINMTTAQAIGGDSQPPHESLKRLHGIINTISWGILFPIGVICARYLRPHLALDPLWFYLHVGCQVSGYILGVTGWALGMKLRTVTPITYTFHLNVGIALFVLATIQVFSLFLRPGKDHKIRKYWNVYHHIVGYTIIVLAIINIFEGLKIYAPGGFWRAGYRLSLTVLLVVALVLEIATWVRYFVKRGHN